MSGAVVCAWPAFVTGRFHPGCQCTRDPLFRARHRFPVEQCRSSAHKRQCHNASSAVSTPQALTPHGNVRDQPSERQQVMSSGHTVLQGSFNTADDPQGTIAGHSRRPVPGDLSAGQQVGNSSTYSKEDRAKLASIPESEMTPEMLRRWRISKANKGKQPWNKGRQHPPDTLARIRAGTQAAMLRPEVLAKVRANHPSGPHTPESKAKISAAVSASYQRRHALKLAQQALQAEASNDQESTAPSASSSAAHPQGSAAPAGKVTNTPRARQKVTRKHPVAKSAEVKENSYPEAQDRSDTGRSASTSAEEVPPGRSSDKRTLAEQHRRNISLAIKQKWADPAYRMRASCSMRSGVVQHKRVSTARENTLARTARAREKLLAARARQHKLAEARRSVMALQSALQASQKQAEALRGDPVGFARQQEVLDDAQALVDRAKEQVAQLVKNTPSLEQVAAELGAKSIKANDVLTPEEQDIAASSFVSEVPHGHSSPSHNQHHPYKALPHSGPQGHAGEDWRSFTDSDLLPRSEVHDVFTSNGMDSSDQIRHSYRHGQLQHAGVGDKLKHGKCTADGSTELQPA